MNNVVSPYEKTKAKIQELTREIIQLNITINSAFTIDEDREAAKRLIVEKTAEINQLLDESIKARLN